MKVEAQVAHFLFLRLCTAALCRQPEVRARTRASGRWPPPLSFVCTCTALKYEFALFRWFANLGCVLGGGLSCKHSKHATMLRQASYAECLAPSKSQ
eukprot:700760-Prymnesium_polylepis.1